MSNPRIPSKPEAEESLIGCVLIEPALYPQLSHVSPDHFYIHRNKWVWEAFKSLYERNEPIDSLTTLNEIEKNGHDLKEFGGMAHITQYYSAVPSTINHQEYAEIVLDMASRRDKLEIAAQITKAAYDYKNPISVSMGGLADQLLAGREKGRDYTPEAIHEDFCDYVDLDIKGVPTYISNLDKVMGNLPFHACTIIAGRTSTGKTGLATCIAKNNAGRGNKTIYFSTEMENVFLWERIACGYAGVDTTKFRSGQVTIEEKNNIKEASRLLRDTYGKNLEIIDDIWTVEEMHQIVAADPDCKLVIVDHLDEISWRDKSDKEWRGKAVEFLRKHVARRLGKSLIVVHQLNRNVEQRQDKRPRLDDLRYDGALEQLADIVLMIYREDYHEDKPMIISPTELILAKHRYGRRLDTANVDYNMLTQEFKNASWEKKKIDLQYI